MFLELRRSLVCFITVKSHLKLFGGKRGGGGGQENSFGRGAKCPLMHHHPPPVAPPLLESREDNLSHLLCGRSLQSDGITSSEDRVSCPYTEVNCNIYRYYHHTPIFDTYLTFEFPYAFALHFVLL